MDNKNEDYGNMDMQNYNRHDDYNRHGDMSSMLKKMGFQNKMKSRNDDYSLDSMIRNMDMQNYNRH